MAYDEYQADRVRGTLKGKGVSFDERKMMGGLCIMVDDKMCVGLMQSKADGQNLLMVRIGEDTLSQVINEKHVLPMEFTGRPLKGYAFIEAEGFDMQEDMDHWVQLCLDFNPLAKMSAKKRAKKRK